MIVGLCKAFPAIKPSEAGKEDADLIRMLNIWDLAYGKRDGEDDAEFG